MRSTNFRVPTDQETLDYFILCELGGAGTDDDVFGTRQAPPETAASELQAIGACHDAANDQPAAATSRPRSIGTRALPRFILGAALTGASMLAQAGSFSCISGTSGDCALAASTLSWNWDGTDFTIFNSGSGYVSEVYFDLASGMSAGFLGGTGTVFFTAGAHPGSLPSGASSGFDSDAAFDSDTRGSVQYGINTGESATFRILAGQANSIDAGALAAGLHVRGLTADATSMVSIPSVMTPVPEPETLAMLMCGFGLVAWATRTRKA
jgi:hypothetical protein